MMIGGDLFHRVAYVWGQMIGTNCTGRSKSNYYPPSSQVIVETDIAVRPFLVIFSFIICTYRQLEHYFEWTICTCSI